MLLLFWSMLCVCFLEILEEKKLRWREARGCAFHEEGLEDAYSYALTMEEEQEEEHFISKFDPFDQWLEPQVKQARLACKREGGVSHTWARD